MTSATQLVRDAQRIVVLSGAGMSTGSGIPDFRGAAGLWTQNPENEKISTLSWYLGDEETRKKAWQYRLHSPVWTSAPNAAHLALVALERQGRLTGIVTQNTDGLHQLAGNDPRLVMEVHGNVRTWRCEKCGRTGPMTEMVDRVRDGEADPRCPGAGIGSYCGGIVRATTVLFEEALPEGVMDRAIETVAGSDLLLAVGTTLSVYPVAGLVPLASQVGCRIVIVNLDETAYDSLADAVVHDDLVATLPGLVAPD